MPASRKAIGLVTLVVAALAVFGCALTEGQCERVCDWEQRCATDAVSVQDCAQQCVKDAETRSTDCQDAFDAFASCTAANQSCPGVNNQCQNEATRLIQHCSCENAKGPLADLCTQR